MKRTVVITGGNRGIGKSIAECFLDEGYDVIIAARTSVNQGGGLLNKAVFFKMDVRDEKAHTLLAQRAISLTGRLDVWINNAGLSSWRPIQSVTERFFNNLVDVNLKGALWGCKAAAKFMANTGGAIINISSIAGKRGSSNNAIYCATKFGLNGLTQSLAKELGRNGITVNAICPVLIKTEGLMEALSHKFSPANGDPELFLTNFTNTNSATGYLPKGIDVGKLAVYLASPSNLSITGQCINVDCGVFPQ